MQAAYVDEQLSNLLLSLCVQVRFCVCLSECVCIYMCVHVRMQVCVCVCVCAQVISDTKAEEFAHVSTLNKKAREEEETSLHNVQTNENRLASSPVIAPHSKKDRLCVCVFFLASFPATPPPPHLYAEIS